MSSFFEIFHAALKKKYENPANKNWKIRKHFYCWFFFKLSQKERHSEYHKIIKISEECKIL